MKESATIIFRDAESSDEAVAIIRYDTNHVALCLSLKSDGDLEVVMEKEDARRLLVALEQSLKS